MSWTDTPLYHQPALKLLGFFRSMANAQDKTQRQAAIQFETSKLQRSSPTIREMPPVTEKHARKWVKYWISSRYIGPRHA